MKTVMILGGNGYLGWNLALAHACRSDDHVIVVDNYSKESWQVMVGVKPLIKDTTLEDKIEKYKAIKKRTNLSFINSNLTEYFNVEDIISKYQPDIIVNAAQQPSAPFSMVNSHYSQITINNNVSITLNLLWVLRDYKQCLLINVGSAGVYSGLDVSHVPDKKVNLNYWNDTTPASVLNSWLPMKATDIYHQSKIMSFGLIDMLIEMWELDVVTVQQSTIYGCTIPENEEHVDLMSRFNYDHIFGTVINRFACQASVAHPFTVYGSGQNFTNIISLEKTIDNFIKLFDVKLKKKQHHIIHNTEGVLSIEMLANMFKRLTGIEVDYLLDPRFELQERTFPVAKLFSPEETKKQTAVLMEEFDKMINFVSVYNDSLDLDKILPEVTWRF